MYVDNSYSNMRKTEYNKLMKECSRWKLGMTSFLKKFILMHTELACVLSFVIFWWLAVIPP